MNLEELLASFARLAELSDDELADARAGAINAFTELRQSGTTADIATLRSLADGVKAIDAEVTRRAEAAAATAAELAALDSLMAEVTAPAAELEETPAVEDELASKKKMPPVPPGQEPDEDDAGKAAAAPARKLAPLSSIRPAQRNAPAPAAAQADAVQALVSTADGRPLASLKDVAALMIEKARTFGEYRGAQSEYVSIARAMTALDSSRVLDPRDGLSNQMKIDAITSPEALTASGGLCAPLTISYALQQLSDAARPVRAGLTRFNAERGGIRYIAPFDFSHYRTAITLWTEVNDIKPGQGGNVATKACFKVDCGAEHEVVIDATVRCLQFGNLMARTYPENVAKATAETLVAHAEKAEKVLLDKIKANSTQLRAGQALGLARDFLYHIATAAAGYRNRHRMDPDAVLEFMAPAWVFDAIRGDLMRGAHMTTDLMSVANATIRGWLNDLRVRPVAFYWDSPTIGVDKSQIFATPSSGIVTDFPDQIQWGLWAPGTHLFLDSGSLDLGLVRDSTLNATNDYQMFAETFEGLATVGIESQWIVSDVKPIGAWACCKDISSLADSDFVPGS